MSPPAPSGLCETAAELAEIKSLLRLSYRDLDRRVTLLEETVPV